MGKKKKQKKDANVVAIASRQANLKRRLRRHLKSLGFKRSEVATDSKRNGVEASLALQIDKQWRIDAAYTYVHSTENGLQEVRRPENIASLNIDWRAMDDKYGANLTVRYNGAQKDFQFTPIGSTRVNLASYTLVNFGADYRINDTWQVYGRVENLLDKKYEEVFSFRSPGRAFYAGIRATFQ